MAPPRLSYAVVVTALPFEPRSRQAGSEPGVRTRWRAPRPRTGEIPPMYGEGNRGGAHDDGPIPCTPLAECGRSEEPEWTWDLLTASQWNHSSALFHWRRVLAMTDLSKHVKAVGQQLAEH